MENLGKILKQNRNKKFLSVEEVSSITKIKEPYIVALEENEVENLPARVYSVGFLKNLADLYNLSQVELIMAYDELKNKNGKSKSFTDLEENINYSADIKEVKNDIDLDDYDVLESPEDDDYSFDKIKKLSIDEGENYEDSLNIIDDYISKSQSELKDISLSDIETKDKDIFIANNDDTYPTSKVMLEFEELMREEERFNTQKLRKQETQRNINMTKDRMKNKKSLNLDVNKKSSGNIMVLILLGIAIIILFYIIITAILNR